MSARRRLGLGLALLTAGALLVGCGADGVRVYGSIGVGYYSGYTDIHYRGACCRYGGVRPPPPSRPPPVNRPPPTQLPSRPVRPPSPPSRPRPARR